MRKTVVSILQQRMDKCTSEQFWIVAAITGMDAFLLSQRSTITAYINTVAILAVLAIVTVYGVLFVVHRHKAYYDNRDLMQTLLKNESDVPDSMKFEVNAWSLSELTGVTFYASWVLLGSVGVACCYI
ncbi:MAG: hypothetical protein ACYS7Y_16210 [Planctomycetota bacterium]